MTMPRRVSDIVEHADSLAARFEQYSPGPDDKRDPEAYTALRQAALARAEAERSVQQAVQDARAAGFSWRSIGVVVGTSGEAARQRYSARQDA